MDFNFKRDYERFRKSDEFVEMMKFDDLASVNCSIANLGMDLYCKTEGWAESHPHQPEIDWNKVPVGTRVEVSDDGGRWFIKYFCERLRSTELYLVSNGKTQNLDIKTCVLWKYCRLVEDNPEYYKD